MARFTFSHQPKKVSPVETEYRKIQTPLPVPESLPIIEAIYKNESHSMHGQIPMVWDYAEDFIIGDAWGNRWIDFTSTIFVANAGHGNKRILNALTDVIKKPLLHTYTYASKERADYLTYLIENTPKQFEKAFLLSAGTETTEAALKLMRLNGQNNGKKRGGIICFDGAFHGRTIGAQMMSGNPAAKEWIGYHDPDIHHLAFPYQWLDEYKKDPSSFFSNQLQKLIESKSLNLETDFCGIMLETFQGWGAIFYPDEFIEEISLFASKHNLLVAFDEMQAGFGRTGKLFGYMHYDIEPDILCCGKGASSGMPLGIVLGSKEIMDLPDIGSMSSTHSANPLCCAAGKANLEALIEDHLIDNSFELGQIFHEKLNIIMSQFPEHIKYVYGEGLLAGVIFQNKHGDPLTSLCDTISEMAFHRGLLVVHTGRESIKLAPPLSINKEALIEGLNVFEECIDDAIHGS